MSALDAAPRVRRTRHAGATRPVDLVSDGSDAIWHARNDRTLARSAGAVTRFLRAARRHVDGGEGDLGELVELADIARLAVEARDVLARRLLAEDYSYGEVGRALGVARSTVESRYRGSASRRPGGQPGVLR